MGPAQFTNVHAYLSILNPFRFDTGFPHPDPHSPPLTISSSPLLFLEKERKRSNSSWIRRRGHQAGPRSHLLAP